MRTFDVIAALCAAAIGAAAWFLLSPRGEDAASAADAALEQTVLAVPPAAPLAIPTVSATDDAPFDSDRLRGAWTVVFFGFTSCPDVCPTTLQVLAAAAREPASGVAAGSTRLVFVTVDPERDTVPRMKAYLSSFRAPIVGVSGERSSIKRVAERFGAAATGKASGMDHSTSLFVVDPAGRLAAVLLHPGDAHRLAADIGALRAAQASSQHVSTVP
jgi:protein SCO1/2